MTTCFCRNTTQSNGWCYQDNTFHDKHANGSNLRRDIYTKDQYHYQRNTERKYHDTNRQQKQASGDHRIRITVNCGPESNTSSNLSNNSDENESAASVTIVEIDDSHQSDDDIDTPNIIRNSLNGHTSKLSNHTRQPYNEKPIDVPEDFERKAYELQRNELSPFVRILEPHSQVPLIFFLIFQFNYQSNH